MKAEVVYKIGKMEIYFSVEKSEEYYETLKKLVEELGAPDSADVKLKWDFSCGLVTM